MRVPILPRLCLLALVSQVACRSPLPPAGSNTDSDSDTDTDTDTDTDSDPGPDTTALGSTMIAISPGTFQMGSDDDGFAQDAPVHTVTLTHAFEIGRTEVTQAEWAMWTGAPDTAPSEHADCPDCPVEEVSWNDVARYANALSDAEGLQSCYNADGSDIVVSDLYSCTGYRLPTEAEWEYAARAGETYTYSGSDTAGDVAWTSDNSDSTQQVAGLAPNAWGLYDMSGNVWEWANDWYDDYSRSPATDPTGPSSGSYRVFRGGSWDRYSSGASVAIRYGYHDPGGTNYYLGFRLARSLP